MSEVERLGDRDEFGFLDFKRTLDRLKLLALFEDTLHERGDLSVRIGEERVGFRRFGGCRLGCNSREVDPLEPGCGSTRGGCCYCFGFGFHSAKSLVRAARGNPSQEQVHGGCAGGCRLINNSGASYLRNLCFTRQRDSSAVLRSWMG